MYDKKLSEDIDKMTYGRVHLWDKLYCDEKCGKDFSEILNKRFETDIRQDIATSTYTFELDTRLDIDLISEVVKECIIEAIESMHNNNDITNEEYDDFKSLEDNLFIITARIENRYFIKV